MQLVNKQDNLPAAALHVFQDSLQTLFKFSPVFGPRYESTHIQGKYFFIFQSLGHIPTDDTLCQPFHNRRLAYARFSDQDRIVFCLTGQDTDNIPYFIVSPNDRIQFLIPCFFYQVLPVFLQRIISRLRVIACDSLISSHSGKRLQEPFSRDAVFLPDRFDLSVWMFQHRQKQMLYGNVLISHLFCLIFGTDQHFIQVFSNIDLTSLYFRPSL